MANVMTRGDAACLACEAGGVLELLGLPLTVDAMKWAIQHCPEWRYSVGWEKGVLVETPESGSFCGCKKSIPALVNVKWKADGGHGTKIDADMALVLAGKFPQASISLSPSITCCTCLKEYEGELMIECSEGRKCNGWVHPGCCGLSDTDVDNLTDMDYICPGCVSAPSVKRRRR